MTDTKQHEALRQAARLRNVCAIVRSKSYPLSDLIPLMQEAADTLERTGSENAALQQGYDAARLEIEARNKQLVKEAARTAEEKLRADRMTEQHRMQCQMREGLEREIEALRSRQCLHQIAEPGVVPEHALKAMTLEQATGGMTLRDYFAAQALPAVYRDLWEDVRAGRYGSVPEEWRMGVALDAYALADAMLCARTQDASHE